MRWLLVLGVLGFACSSNESGPAASSNQSSSSSSGDAPGDPGDDTSEGDDDGDDGRDASAPDASASSSHGSGGLGCASEQKVSGRTVCVAKVGDVEVKLALPADAASNPAPLGLALYVHGDGAAAHTSNSAAKAMLPWADAHHAIVASLLAPNRCSWWIEPSYTTCEETDASQASHEDTEQLNAPQFEAALAAIRAAYDVGNGPVFYYGSSGGSIFLAASFLPKYGNAYPGAFALNCGGEKPWADFAWDVTDPSARGATKLYFTYGAADEQLIPELPEAPAAFSALGFPVDDHETPNQTQHCTFETDNHGRAVQVWNDYLGE